MDPITLTGVGIVALFFLMGGSSDNGGGNGNGDGGGNGNGNGGGNGKLNCAPGLVRDTDGRCKKAGGKTKPGEKTDPSKISKKRPDKIDRDDAWIGPGCVEIMFGPDWFDETIVPFLGVATMSGFGFYPVTNSTYLIFYNEDLLKKDDFEAFANYGPAFVVNEILESYGVDCGAELMEFEQQNAPTMGDVAAWGATDPEQRGPHPIVQYVEYQVPAFVADLPISDDSQDMILAIYSGLLEWGHARYYEDNGLEYTPVRHDYPAKFTPKASSFQL